MFGLFFTGLFIGSFGRKAFEGNTTMRALRGERVGSAKAFSD